MPATLQVPQGFEPDQVPAGFEPDSVPQGFEPDAPTTTATTPPPSLDEQQQSFRESTLAQSGNLKPAQPGELPSPADAMRQDPRYYTKPPGMLETAFKGVGEAAAAALNVPEAMYRDATGITPKRGVISRDAAGREVLTAEDVPLHFQAGKPAVEFSRTVLQPEGNAIGRLIEGFLTPENIALFPFAGSKAVQAAFLAQTAPAAIEAATKLVSADTPPDQRQDAATELLINGLMSAGISAHLIRSGAPATATAVEQTTTEVPSAIRQQTPSQEVLGDQTPKPQEQVGLQEVGTRNAQPEIASTAQTEAALKETQAVVQPENVAAGDVVLPPSEKPSEKVTAAAVKINGELFEGTDHADAIVKFIKKTGLPEDEVWSEKHGEIESGFLTDTGRFIDLEEAAALAGKKPGTVSHAAEIITSSEPKERPPATEPVKTTAPLPTVELGGDIASKTPEEQARNAENTRKQEAELKAYLAEQGVEVPKPVVAENAPTEPPRAAAAPSQGKAADVRSMTDAELKGESDALDASMKPFYDKLEAMPDEETFLPRSSNYTPAAQALHDSIKPFSDRKMWVQHEITRRETEIKNKATMEARDKRVAEAPVFQRRNGWEIVKEGVDYVLRDPATKEDIYRGKLKRVREVADESKPTPPASQGEGGISQGPGAASPGDVPSEPPQAKAVGGKAESAPEQERPSGVISPFSVALHNIWTEAKNVIKGLAGQSMPRTTKANRIAGETGVEYASSRIAARPQADLFSASVLEGTNVDPIKFGAALVEDNLASIREGFRQKATELTAEGKPDEAAKATANADAVKSIVGAKGSPFKTWDEYQDFLTTPEFKAAAAKHIQHWKETIEPQFREAQRLDPDIELPSRGLQTGARVNLKVVLPDEAAGKAVASVDFPRITGTFRKKSPFGVKAKGTGDVYDIHYPEIIANTFEKQLEIANKNRFDKSLVEAGLAEIHRPGWQGNIGGKRVTSFPLKRGSRPVKTSDEEMVAANQSVNIYVRSDLANEYRVASNVDQKFSLPYVTRGIGVVNRAALAGLTDFTVHTSNLLTALFNRPVSGNLFNDSLLSVTGRADVPVAIVKAIVKATQDNKAQLAELAEIGAMRPSMDATGFFGTSGRILKAIDRTVRLTLDDTFQQLAKDGIVEDTPTNRREFVNQVGQYNRRLQGQLTRFLRDTGFGPFVTAGKTFNALGVKMVTLSPGAKATSNATAAALRVNALSKWAGVAVVAGTLNYILTANNGGGVMGRPGTPLGYVDTGKNDKNGKPLAFPLADVVGVGRGLRVTGLRGIIESKRLGLDTPTAIDAAARDIINSQIGPAAGPVVRFASVAASGKAPAINVGRVSDVAPPGENQTVVNVGQALLDANPVVASVHDLVQGKSLSESMSRQLPRFTLRPGRRAEMVEKFPEIVEKARAKEFEDWIVHEARQLPMKERREFINKQIQRLPEAQMEHARKTMEWRGVYKYQ